MPKTVNGGNINFNVNMNVNRSGINDIVQPLKQIQNQLNTMSTDKLSQEFQEAAASAKQLESIISSSWNDKLGQLNLDKFNQSIKNSYGSVSQLKASLTGAGAIGQQAFNNLAHSVLNTNLELKQSNKLLDDMATSMANTVKWGITSSIFNTITSSIQSAYYYAKDLDTSLNNIRIVTGQSADEMERFAKIANEAAGGLGRSTLDYTKAALSFYQQGLSDEEVQARTEVTLKAQNITGVGTEMVDYLTSVWNGFKATAEDAEGYVDKLAKVADASASDMSELAIAMSKVAATANMMGVNMDQLTAQLATVIATTRQAPESVGTAFKTIYSRLNDIKTGADGAQISLGNYSSKMAKLGFNVLDANNKLRDTGQVIEQIGSRWTTLSRQQQVYLASIMGGQRQITQITALFENWTTYSELLNDSLSAQGTLNQKNDVYLESTAAHMKQLAAETERTYDILFNQKAVNTFADVFKNALSLFNDYIEGIGGGANVFINFGAAVANVFNKQIGTAINTQLQNIEKLKNNLAHIKAQQEWSQTILQQGAKDQVIVGHATAGDTNISTAALEKQAAITQRTLQIRKALTQEQYNQLQDLQRQIGVEQTRIDYLQQYKKISLEILDDENISLAEAKARLSIQNETLNIQKQQHNATANAITNYKLYAGQVTEERNTRQDLLNIIEATFNEETRRIELASILEKITKGQTLTQDQINKILVLQNKEIEKQQALVNKVKQAVEGREAAESGKLQKLKEEEAARERIASQMQDSAARTINIQNVVQKVTGGVQALSSAIGGISTVLDETATSSEKLNGVWAGLTGTISGIANAFAPGSGFLIQGISGLVKSSLELFGVWDNIEEIFKSNKERVEELNQSISQINQNDKTKNTQISKLESLIDQYETLSDKAGNYGSTLDRLTQEEKSRYHEITNEFSQYNQSVIAGYDEQGNAIVKGQEALKQTIQVLKQAKLQADKASLGSMDKVIQGIAANHQQREKPLNERKKLLSNDITNKNFEIANLSQEPDFTDWQIDREVIGDKIKQFYEDLWKDQGSYIKEIVNNDSLASNFQYAYNKQLQSLYKIIQEINEGNYDNLEQALNISNFITSGLKNFNNSTEWLTNVDSFLAEVNKQFQSREEIIHEQSQKIQELGKEVSGLQNDLDNVGTELEKGRYFTQEEANTLLLAYPIFNDETWSTLEENVKQAGSNMNYIRSVLAETITNTTIDQNIEEILQQKVEELNQIYTNYGEAISSSQEKAAQRLQEQLTENSSGLKIRNVIFNSIQNDWLNNEQILKMFQNEQQKNFVLKLIEEFFNIKDLSIVEKNGKLIVDSFTTEEEKIVEQISNSFKIKENKNALTTWLLDTFDPDSIKVLSAELEDSTEDLPKTLDGIKEWVNNFFKGLDETEKANNVIEHFDKVVSIVSKIQSGKDISYKEKVNLMQQLGLSAEDVQNAETVINQLEQALYQLKDSLDEQDILKRAEGLSLIYNSFEKINEALSKERISPEEADLLYTEVLNNQLETLKLTQQELQKYAQARNLPFDSSKEKLYTLELYNQSEELKKQNEELQKNAKAREDAALAAAKAKGQVIPNGKSALDTLKKSESLSSDEISALAYLETTDEKLRQIAEEKGRNSKEYTAELQKQLQIQSNLTEKARQQTLAIYQSKKAELERQQIALQNDLDSVNNKLGAAQTHALDDGVLSTDEVTEINNLLNQQTELTNKINNNKNELLQIQKNIITEEQKITEIEEQQETKASQVVDSFKDMANTLTSGGELSDEQMKEFSETLDYIISQYPELQGAANTLKETWLAGTLAYSEALSQISNALDELVYTELNEQLSNAFNEFQDDLDNISQIVFDVNSDKFDEFTEQVEKFLQADKTITIAVHTDAENEFERISAELDNIYQAAGKIGQNFVIAAEDIRELNYVFPGILEGMQQLDNGSYQLNANIVKRAIATAQAETGADAEAVVEKLKHQSTLLHEKAATYKKMAEAAATLAKAEVDSEGGSSEAITTISNGLREIRAKNAQITVKNEVSNEKVLADATKEYTETNAQNWAGSSQSSANSVYQFARMAIGYYRQVATAAKSASEGLIYQPWLDAPSYISSGFTGTSVSNKQNNIIKDTEEFLKSPTSQRAQQLQQSYQKMYQITERAANDIDGMIAQIGAKVNSVGKGLENVYRGEGIKGTKDTKDTKNTKTPKTKDTKTPKTKDTKTPKTKDTKESKKKDLKKKKEKEQKEKEEKQQDPDFIESLEDERDIYHDIDLEIKSISKDLDRVQKIENKLYGKDLINNLNKQVQLLEKQVAAHQEKVRLAAQQRDEIYDSLKEQGVLFDANTGAITNYAEILDQKLGKINTLISLYNQLTAEEQKEYKAVVESAKEDYEKFKKQIGRYEEVINEVIPDLTDEIRQMVDKQVEIAISKFNMAIEIELDLSQAKRDWNDFKKKVIYQIREDDIYGNTTSNLENLFSYYQKDANSFGLIPDLTEHIVSIMEQLDQINSGGSSQIYGNNKAKALEDLKNYADQLMANLGDVEDLLNEVKESFYDMADAAQVAFDEQSKEFDFLNNLIEHDKKLIELLYGDEALEKINTYNQKQIENDNRELDFQKRQRDFWYSRMMAEKTRMENLDKESNEYAEAEKRFKVLQQHWMSAVNDFNSQVQASISHLLDQYKNNVDIIFKDLEKNLTNGKSLDYISEEWELINDNADDYLDTVNSIYQIDKLQRSFQDAIENSQGNLKAQKSLTNLMNEQLKMLKNKDKLTKYDVDRANLLLQIEIKRLALEQSRNNKSKLRLRRDAQGNYSYQYTADEQQVSSAEQDLADARNSLYNLDKDQYVKTQDTILSVQKDFSQKLKALYQQYPIWTEEAEEKKRLLIEQYGIRINNLVGQNQHIRANLMGSTFGELARFYDTDVQNFTNMSNKEQQILMEQLVPQWDTGIQTMADKIAGQGGLIPTCQEAFTRLDLTTKGYEESLSTLEEQAGISLDQVASGIDENITKTGELLENNEELITAYDNEWEALDRIIEQVETLTLRYKSAKDEAIAAAAAANKFLEIQQQHAADEAKDEISVGTFTQEDLKDADTVIGGTKTSSKTTNKPNLKIKQDKPNLKIKQDKPDLRLKKTNLTFKTGIEEEEILGDKFKNTPDVPKTMETAMKMGEELKEDKSSSNRPSWERIMKVYNLINSGAVGVPPYRKTNLMKKGFNDAEISKGQELINRVYPTYLKGQGMSWSAAKRAMGYDTGGYTGEWGSQGKLAILHEKELILNEQDTKNILSAVEATRDTAELLKLININDTLSKMLSGLVNQESFNNLDQNVYITASFPSVNSRVEIEEAFSNLINRASQYSFNTRK